MAMADGVLKKKRELGVLGVNEMETEVKR